MDHREQLMSRIAFWGFVVIAGFFLWTEHRAHVLGALPYLLLLACPLMHLLHRGHHHGHSGGGSEPISKGQRHES